MKICFVAHFAYGAMTSDASKHIGGVERQTALMSQWLANRGHDVSVATWTEGRAADETINGVRVLKVCRNDAGIAGLRFFHPRWTGLNQAMARADADLYYQNCAEAATGQVALWAKRHDRRFVFSVASDPEVHPSLALFDSRRERWLYRYGLRHADRIFVQSQAQQTSLQDGFGLPSEVMKMPSDMPVHLSCGEQMALRAEAPRVLWLGRLAPVKNVERLFAVAKQLPDIAFDVVGGEDKDPDYAQSMLQAARALPNVTMHGRLGSDAVKPLLDSCWMLVCTSDFEGFPNTFLESWACGRPVISTVDPDGLIDRLGLGAVGATASALADRVRDFVTNRERLDAASGAATQYFREAHAIAGAMPRFEQAFADVLDGATA